MTDDSKPVTLHAEDHLVHVEELAGWEVRVSSFRLGECWYASVENVDPGARIARAEGRTRAEAEGIACEKARQRLALTRTFPAS